MHIFYLKEVSSKILKVKDFREPHERRYLITAMRTSVLPADCRPGSEVTVHQLLNIINNGHKVIIEPEHSLSEYYPHFPVTLHLAPGYKVKK